jgi:hypothetical protein
VEFVSKLQQSIDELIGEMQGLYKESELDDTVIDHIAVYTKQVKEIITLFKKGTINSDNFINLTNIEDLIGLLIGRHEILAKDLLWDQVNKINEDSLILKKKLNTEKKE